VKLTPKTLHDQTGEVNDRADHVPLQLEEPIKNTDLNFREYHGRLDRLEDPLQEPDPWLDRIDKRFDKVTLDIVTVIMDASARIEKMMSDSKSRRGKPGLYK
jgi:hypothetical protein